MMQCSELLIYSTFGEHQRPDDLKYMLLVCFKLIILFACCILADLAPYQSFKMCQLFLAPAYAGTLSRNCSSSHIEE